MVLVVLVVVVGWCGEEGTKGGGGRFVPLRPQHHLTLLQSSSHSIHPTSYPPQPPSHPLTLTTHLLQAPGSRALPLSPHPSPSSPQPTPPFTVTTPPSPACNYPGGGGRGFNSPKSRGRLQRPLPPSGEPEAESPPPPVRLASGQKGRGQASRDT